MPPKRRTRSSAKKSKSSQEQPAPTPEGANPTVGSQQQPPPASSDDAKPNIDVLNAALGAEEQPSAPLADPNESLTSNSVPTVEASFTETPDDPLSNSAPSSSATARGKKPVKQPKFAGRRSQAKREELQKAEDEKRKGESEPARREQARSNRARGGRGRGRGGYVGESERQTEASGPFSAGQVHRESKHIRRPPPSSGWKGLDPGAAERPERPVGRKSWSHTTGKTTVQDGKAVKQEAGPSTESKLVPDHDGDISMNGERAEKTTEDAGYISSDEDEDSMGIQRVNIENLGFVDLSKDHVDYNPFAPVRVLRVAHKDRTVGINAEGATDQEGSITVDANDVAAISISEQKKGKQRADKDVEVAREKKTFQAVYSDSESEAEPISEPQLVPDEEDGVDASTNLDAGSKTRGKRKARASSNLSAQDPPDYQTHEELEEWRSHQRDLQILRSELGQPAPTAADNDGDASMTDTSPAGDLRKNKVYLFQFPPVLPDLFPIDVKPDPDDPSPEPADAMKLDPPALINDQSNPIKIEEDAEGQQLQPPTQTLPSGAIGKLKVHASGRVTLDWGGTSLCLGMGSEASFLQDVVLATLPENKEGEAPGVGKAANLGQVKGKFVVTPDWEELLM